jgi:hypothetical protein
MKATFPDGTVFEGTPEEFNAVRGHSGAPQSGHGAAKPIGRPQFWNSANAAAFWNSLDPRRNGGKQKKVLRFLIKKGGRATYEEVKSHLAAKNGQELAGVLANISRNARRETDYKKALAVDWKPDGKGGGFYFIPDDLLQHLKDVEQAESGAAGPIG